jgi:hypothetical protein
MDGLCLAVSRSKPLGIFFLSGGTLKCNCGIGMMYRFILGLCSFATLIWDTWRRWRR